MAKYHVEIPEVWIRTVIVEADNEDEMFIKINSEDFLKEENFSFFETDESNIYFETID